MNKKILVVTPGLANKISHLADSFKNLYEADIIFGQEAKERKIDRILYFFGKGNIRSNKIKLKRKILKTVTSSKIDLLIIIKGLSIEKETLLKIKKINSDIKIFNWTCDDLALTHNQSRDFLESASEYDAIYTSKSENIKNNELEKIGFKNIFFFYQRFSYFHHKLPTNKLKKISIGHDVFFAGYAEEERFKFMNFLAKNGITVNVYGNGWDKLRFKIRKHKNLKVHYRPVLGNDYSQSIYHSKINLCFLRVINRDIHTARSVEIPACGGFMLAERTVEHSHLFTEGEEAEYFSTPDELLKKVKFYLINSQNRIAIAKKGYLKTRSKDYSYDSMSKEMFSTFEDLQS